MLAGDTRNAWGNTWQLGHLGKLLLYMERTRIQLQLQKQKSLLFLKLIPFFFFYHYLLTNQALDMHLNHLYNGAFGLKFAFSFVLIDLVDWFAEWL